MLYVYVFIYYIFYREEVVAEEKRVRTEFRCAFGFPELPRELIINPLLLLHLLPLFFLLLLLLLLLL